MSRPFNRALLLSYLQEVYNFPRPVAEKTIDDLRLDGDGLIFDEVLRGCEEWHTQVMREAGGRE